jgi:homocysteine S-methyltransferase
MNNPIEAFLERQGALILDGGLASELEAWGYDLKDELWSARLLLDEPEAIRAVHEAYLVAGADCVISASYQATIPGFMRRGLDETEAEGLLRLSVQLALAAREEFWADPANRVGRLRPIVAASVGPYGAFLADGSEYTGAYKLSADELEEWHRHRWHILAHSGADLLACETIPSYQEALALRRLLAETPEIAAWFTFSCRDGIHISDGTPLARCIESLDAELQIVAVGINCTPPRFIPSLIAEARRVTSKPIIVYPNSGEYYDAATGTWAGLSDAAEFGTYSREWRKEGAALIGGCCRTRPAHIQQIADRFRRRSSHGELTGSPPLT